MYSLEKMIPTPILHWELLGKTCNITFSANTYLAYFLLDDLDLPPLEKPPTMVFVLYVMVLSVIFSEKIEGVRVGV